MSLIRIPFKKFSDLDIPRPWVPAIITNPHTMKSTKIWGLIDTGADECALPADYAVLLGHNFQAGKQKTINTGNGTTLAYSHTMCIQVEDLELKNILIDFMPNLQTCLLGVKNFLSKFILTVDYPKKYFSLQS
ncbi:MAG: retroviral-like aspartic protease family protein [Candidatus Omnitrophica bacterium]|nr:retroviral-like aspartic protease family protein [Candidatus Omnitrophota bacterium]